MVGILTLLLTLLAALIGGFGCSVKRGVPPASSGCIQWMVALCMLGSLACSILNFHDVYMLGHVHSLTIGPWIEIGKLLVTWSLQFDQLASLMLLVIASVSSLVHIYSIWYMHDDKNVLLFLFYLSLFTLLMMILVVSDNLLQLFFGWEGVGLCSYLLIGFWGERVKSSAAAFKAFIMNRIGDFGLIIGIALTYAVCGSLDFNVLLTPTALAKLSSVVPHLPHCCITYLDLICLCFLLGCIGKSAQIFLQGWLPDAMEGPTPASSLIHAATMVTAGVFLVVRCAMLYEASGIARTAVLIIGTATALMAAIIAVAQSDIKKIIAYSTCSQLGFMFAACGVGAYPVAMFHLFTHAFFKSLLFLCAGSIIHAADGEQDIAKIGNVSKLVPFTKTAMIVAALAISGIPPLAGHYSKDAIMELALSSGGALVFGLLLLAALLTSFYSWRIVFAVFCGSALPGRMGHGESPIAVIPLAVLTLMSAVAGYIGVKYMNIWGDSSYQLWKSVLHVDGYIATAKSAHDIPNAIKLLPLAAGVLGMAGAYLAFRLRNSVPSCACFTKIASFVKNGLGFEWFYAFIGNIAKATAVFYKWLDVNIVDVATARAAVSVVQRSATAFIATDTGKLYHAAFTILFGIVIMFMFMLIMF